MTDGSPTAGTPLPAGARPVAGDRRSALLDRQLTARLNRRVSRLPDVPVRWCIGLAFLGSLAGGASAFVGGNGREVPWPAAGIRQIWPGNGDSAAQLVGLAGVALVVAMWLALGIGVLRQRTGVRGVLGFSAAAVLPLALAPPLFSEDAWTYIAIGELVDRHFDPYRVGWGVLSRGDYTANLSLFWRDSPSPYSPLALRLLEGIAALVGGGLSGGVVVLRLLTLVALGASVPLLLILTGDRRLSQAPVLWLVVANPLLIIAFVSALHLDVLVLPLMLAALLAYRRGHLVTALALAGVAGQVKVTALVLAGFFVAARMMIPREGESTARRARAAAGLAVVGIGVFVGINLGCGLGFGWVHALSIPGRANNVLTPLDALTDLASVIGIGPGPVPGQVVATSPTWLTTVGLTLGIIATVVLGLKVGRLGIARGAAYSLILLTLGNGAVWSWYFCVPFVLLVIYGNRREQLVVIALSTVLVFSVRPDDGGTGGSGFRAAAILGDLVFLAIYAAAAVVLVRRPGVPASDGARQVAR